MKMQSKIAKIKEANKDIKDEFFGVPGQRTDMQLVVDKVIGYEDYFIILLHDDENRQFKWSTANNPFTVGNKYSVKGTIVRHNEYNGIKQTVINRCKVLAA